MAEEQKKEAAVKGLKRMRAGWIGQPKPEYNCDNCKCKRYSECGCIHKKEEKHERSHTVVEEAAS